MVLLCSSYLVLQYAANSLGFISLKLFWCSWINTIWIFMIPSFILNLYFWFLLTFCGQNKSTAQLVTLGVSCTLRIALLLIIFRIDLVNPDSVSYIPAVYFSLMLFLVGLVRFLSQSLTRSEFTDSSPGTSLGASWPFAATSPSVAVPVWGWLQRAGLELGNMCISGLGFPICNLSLFYVNY